MHAGGDRWPLSQWAPIAAGSSGCCLLHDGQGLWAMTTVP